MNVYCVKCGSEMEIMRDLGSELRVYPCGCGGKGKPKRQPITGAEAVRRLLMCYCHNCKRYFHPLGIMSHRAVHRRNGEKCVITYSTGVTKEHNFTPSNKRMKADATPSGAWKQD